MINKNCIFILSVIVFISCNNKESVTALSLRKSVSEFSDTLFFSEVKGLTENKGIVYFSDLYRNQVIAFNEQDLSLQAVIGKQGAGPNEIVHFSHFAIYEDSVYIFDEGSFTLRCYDITGKQTGNHALPQKTEYAPFFRFLISGSHTMLCPTFSSSGAVGEYNWFTDSLSFWGTRFTYRYALHNHIRNNRHLLRSGEDVILISDNEPVIEFYDKDRRKKATYDYSDIEMVKRRLAYIERNVADSNSYGKICEDAYVFEDKLYLLLMTNNDKGDFFTNHLAVFTLTPPMTFLQLLELPGRLYDTFCVSENAIIAYNSQTSSFEIVEKPLP